jgi:tetratricopeptide (TPR) repeat protein
LEKAKQRDLTAARNYLRQSLQLYKEHIPARNLLGLVYYALGEPTQALREWVLSENFQPEENPATQYLHRMEKDMSIINGSITRYNQALMYLELGSRDLALIQMKQLMTRSYQMIRAKQLMALLYMQDGYFSRAQKLLRQCARLDRGDPTTRRYLQALEKRKAVGKDSSIRQAVVEAVETPREAEVIIPQNNREYGSYFMYVLYIMIGLLLGAGLVYYIVVPTVRRQEQEKNRTAIESYEDGMSALRGEIVDYTADIDRLNNQISLLKETIDESGLSGELVSYQALLPVLVAYINNDVESIMDEFVLLDPDIDDELYQNIYKRLYNDYNDNMGYRSFYRAMEYVDTGEYQKALPLFELTYQINGMDARILYYIGICHEMTSDYDKALYYYQYTIVHYPDDAWTQNASARLKSILSIHEDLKAPEIEEGDPLEGITVEKPGTVANPSGNDVE